MNTVRALLLVQHVFVQYAYFVALAAALADALAAPNGRFAACSAPHGFLVLRVAAASIGVVMCAHFATFAHFATCAHFATFAGFVVRVAGLRCVKCAADLRLAARYSERIAAN